jgi:SAM-dependent methyltransferase
VVAAFDGQDLGVDGGGVRGAGVDQADGPLVEAGLDHPGGEAGPGGHADQAVQGDGVARVGARSLAELHRVLRPGGELRFFEHVRADTAELARVQQLADVVWPTLLGGCHTTRDTLAAITAAGFRITSVQRFRFPESRLPQPAAPHVLGVAQRPDSPRPGTACARPYVRRNLR